jgi:DNA-binding transcriptional LysR family regulator
MEFRQLRYFVAVAEERHFGRAAARLHLAQPALSQQIRNLERELGAQLFERSSRPIGLTAAGEAVLGEARRTLRQVEIATERTRRAGRGKLGRLTIGFLGSVAHDLIPKLMTAFSEARPDVALELEEVLFHDQLAGFQSGRLDVAFLREPIDDPRLVTARVRDDPVVAIAAEGHWLGRASSIDLAELADERWVFPARSAWPAGWDWWHDLCRERGFTPELAATATSLEVLVGLVATDEGVSFLPATARALPRPGVVVVPIDDVKSAAAIAWAPERDGALVREFVSTALELARLDARRAPASTR